MISISVLVASSGRPTLARTLASVGEQMAAGDELLADVNDDAPWGHKARNRLMPRSHGDVLLFMDDDDVYTPGALEVVRRTYVQQPRIVHMFRMRYADGSELWRTPTLECGNVSTQMVCVPREVAVGCEWPPVYEGDWHFIQAAVAAAGGCAFHEDVIALVRP